jgi:putative transposase
MMARLPRLVLVGHAHHVVIRGNNREPIFIADEDYKFYLEKLKLACEKHLCDVHAYVLMTNHVHLLITPHKEDSIAKVMQMVGRYYVQYFNYCYRRTGTLWEGRYKSTVIDSDRYALICYRYIELNPVRAGMVEEPADYPWSSYRFNALGIDDAIVTMHVLYASLGQTVEQRRAYYRGLFEHHISAKQIDLIRDATNKSWVLGNDFFKQKIENKLGIRVTPKSKGGDRRSASYQKRNKIN